MSTTTAAVTEQIPSSRTEPDLSRVAKGKPRSHIDGVPVYSWGQAPPYLRTQTQLGEERLKLTEGQPVLAYIGTRKYGDIPLYDPMRRGEDAAVALVYQGPDGQAADLPDVRQGP